MNEKDAAYSTLSHLEKTRSTTAAVWMLPWICCCLFTECWFFSLLIKGLMQPHPPPITMLCWITEQANHIHSTNIANKITTACIWISSYWSIHTHKLPDCLLQEPCFLFFHSSISSHGINYLISPAWKNFGAKFLGQNDCLIVLSNKTQQTIPAHCHC